MGNMVRTIITGDKRETWQDNFDETAPKSLEDDTLVVINDYPPATITEPFFRLGEKLQVIKQHVYWWKVRSMKTGRVDFIPDMHVAKIYHGWLFEGVERQKAEELLLLPVNHVGSFMVRQSSTERGVYSLSVKHRNIKHYRIFRLDNSWYYISPRLTFQCLEDMIHHYSDCADGLCCMLTAPCLSPAAAAQTDSAAATDAPVIMRRNFDWDKVDRTELVSPESCSDNMVSYGVRNSIAAHLFFSQEPTTRDDRKKKSNTVYGVPQNTDYMDNF